MRARRDFLFGSAAGAALLAMGPAAGCARTRERSPASSKDDRPASGRGGGSGAGPSPRARVVLVRAPGVMSAEGGADRARLRRMLELGLQRLAGTGDARAALSRWVRPVDTVGLKVNCLAGRQMSTRLALVEALVDLLAACGLPRSQAIVFDRSDRDLRLAGYPIRASGSDFRSLGNDRAGYEAELSLMPSGASRCSRIATRTASVLINLPVLKDHGLSGVTAALKNNFGLIHNPNKFHLNGCDPHVGEVNALPFVRGKQRLVVCDALRVQCEGGPAYHAAGVAPFDGLLLGTDPVALDVIAWETLETLRRERSLPSLERDKRPPLHIAGAAKLGLGVSDRRRIELVEVKA